MWSKYVTRRLAVQVAQAWNFGWGKAMRKVYGVSVDDTLVFRDRKKTDYYVDEQQHQKYIAGLYKLLENRKFLSSFHQDAQAKLEAILLRTKHKLKQDLSKLSNAQLLKTYLDFILPNQTQFYVRMWTVFNIGEPLANVVRKKLGKYVRDKRQITEYLLNLSSPLVPNDVLNERFDLLKLALAKNRMSRSKFFVKLTQHTEKYKHIPMFDFDHDPYTSVHFQKEIGAIRNPRKELHNLKILFANRRKEFARIRKELKLDHKFRLLLQFLKENVFLRDYRDMIRQKYNLELKRFYTEIARRFGLSVLQVATLTNDEIIEYLSKGGKIPKVEVKKREKAYLLIQIGSQAKIYSGSRALDEAKKVLREDNLASTKIITGVIGSSGKAKGRVRVVYTNRDLYKVKRGDVMVATMTRQDFVVAIRKAAALITDEGSVTAHAAIISRELGIACIVATKIATKVLKDGDLVEVNADEGIVRIIKRRGRT